MIKGYINKYRDEFKKCIEDMKKKETFYKQIPNLLTFLRLVGGLPAGLMYYFGNQYVALGLIAFLWGTDAIDGKIARKYNIQSKLGADMDAIADKIMFLASSLPLLVNAPGLILNFVLEGIISLINVIGRLKGLDTKTVLSGKVKTVSLSVTLVFGYLVQFLGLSASVLTLLIGLTTGLQLIAIKDYVVNFNKMNKKMKINGYNSEVKKNLDENDLIYEKEQVKTLQLETVKTSLDELRKERKFILATQQPDIVYKGKKRVRSMIQEKKNNF